MFCFTEESSKVGLAVACFVMSIYILSTMISIEEFGKYDEVITRNLQVLPEGDVETILQSADNENETFSQVAGTDMFVRSATYDPRFNHTPFIRMLLLSPKNRSNVYCHVRCAQKLVVVKARVELNPSGPVKRCKWVTMILKCDISFTVNKPLSVSVTASKFKTVNRWYDVVIPQYKPPDDPKYGVCVQTMYHIGDKHTHSIIEWFELQKLLGVDNVILYGTYNVSVNVLRILKTYQDSGFLIYYTWTLPFPSAGSSDIEGIKRLPSSHRCVDCFARAHIHHSCFYEHMDRFTYISLLDIDEFIIPTTHYTWKEMLKEIEAEKSYDNFACYTFLGACFSSAANESNIVEGQNMSVYMVTKTQQIVNQFGIILKSRPFIKSIVKPQFLDIPGTHVIRSVVPPRDGCVWLPIGIGRLHHYRKGGCRRPPENVSFDDRMLRYYDDLLPRMERTLAKLIS